MKIYQNSSEPIYKQISSQLRDQILTGKLRAGDPLPSIRALAQDLKISVITTMKAYEELSAEGLVTSSKGKGYFVNAQDERLLAEQHMRQLEQHLTDAIHSARIAGLGLDEVTQTLETLWSIDDGAG
ncbi:MAG: GntR family transcriptional regulator [Ruminococcus sp.]|nr:GntR family transcriptional regulator [Ruminococcus sp.]